MKRCKNCGAEIAQDAELCPDCGVNQHTSLTGGYRDRDADEVYCVSCGTLIYRDATVCPECGVEQPSGGREETDRVAAGVLAILLGGLGVHKFYQGHTRNGVIYLCFFWTAIPAILGLVEGILMLTATDEEYQAKYASGEILGT